MGRSLQAQDRYKKEASDGASTFRNCSTILLDDDDSPGPDVQISLTKVRYREKQPGTKLLWTCISFCAPY